MAELTGIGLWSPGFRDAEPGELRETIAELESLGYTALWMPGGAGGPILERAQLLVDASATIAVATGILNIWAHAPRDVAGAHASIGLNAQGRFLLGLGVSHAATVDREQRGRYRKPLTTMRAYLDELDAQPAPVARRRPRPSRLTRQSTGYRCGLERAAAEEEPWPRTSVRRRPGRSPRPPAKPSGGCRASARACSWATSGST